ncbi:MAG: hypothetical protein R3240_02390 [Gammaproteobacteria bacterium]|nr:hypothetical protein [Gammaproteobacteria bacterium]
MEFLNAETTIAATITFILMLVAYKLSHLRKFHIATMVGCMIFDVLMPFYLYMNRNWYERLIEGGEILTFLIWMHIGLVLTVYVLYVMQIKEGRKILAGGSRKDHAVQAKGIILARFLMILAGALLYEPEGVS